MVYTPSGKGYSRDFFERIIARAEKHPELTPFGLIKTGTRSPLAKVSVSENAAIHAYYDSHPKKDKLRKRPCAKKHTRCTLPSVGRMK